MSIDELKPCPFCGNEKPIAARTSVEWVSCKGCGAEGPTAPSWPKAVAAWNTRTTTKIEKE